MTVGWLLALTASLAPVPMATSLGSSGGLSAAAAASGRPPECLSGSKRALARGPSIWEVARVPNLQRYCDRMARAQTALAASPEQALAAATEADALLPNRAAPKVVRARASLALGELDNAARAFAEARALDPRSVEDPSTLHDLARVLARTRNLPAALGVYRALVPRIDLLGTSDRRVAALLEAAHVSMAAEGVGAATLPAEIGKRPSRARLDEAVAYLREARQRPPSALAGDVLLSLALTLDRAGDHEPAEAALAEAQRTFAKLRAGTPEYVAAPGDELALAALLAEANGGAAVKAWEGFLAGPGGKGPWAAAAKARLDQLKKAGGARPSKPASAPSKPGKPR